MNLTQMLVIAVAFVIAGVAKGALGMGMPPIAIGLMTFVLPLQDAIVFMVAPTIVTNIWQAVYGGGFVRLMRRFGTMTVTAIAGVLAVAAWGHVGAEGATAWVGVVLVLYALIALTAWRPKVPRGAEVWANPVIGFASGAMAGITGVAAVPFLPYMQSLDIDRHDLVQGLGILFLFMIGAITAGLAWQGGFQIANSVGGLLAVAPTMVGVWLGQILRRRLSPEMFRRVFLLSLLAIGLHMAHTLIF
ncbi:MAG TPA: sulfite exporter TauE/SafE family protein [Reyranella sp.]|nr:sulfite exporter TauE/SafE family protein [Reyranella sp.]